MINVKENRRSNQEYTIQTERQTQDTARRQTQDTARRQTQDTARRQTKHKHNTENYKDEQHGPHQKHRPHQKPGMNTDAREL